MRFRPGDHEMLGLGWAQRVSQKGSEIEPKGEPEWPPKWGRHLPFRDPKNVCFPYVFAQNDPPKGDKNGTGNEAENEPEMEPDWTQNGGTLNNYIEINNYYEISKSE